MSHDSRVTVPEDRIAGLLAQVVRLRRSLTDATLGDVPWSAIHPAHLAGAHNLAAYLELRKHDIRELQAGLSRLGLSSLGRLEHDVLGSVSAVEAALRTVLGEPYAAGLAPEPSAAGAPEGEGFDFDRFELARNSVGLFGPKPEGRITRIMVTMPSEAAHSPELIDAVVDRGAGLVRINCAHDDASAWTAMIGKVRHAERRVGHPVRVVMDLAGPKLRTGPIAAGPPVIKVRPERNALGQVTRPARFWLVAEGSTPAPVVATTATGNEDTGHDDTLVQEDPFLGLPQVPVVDTDWLGRLLDGELLELDDARDRVRTLTVERLQRVEGRATAALVSTDRTCYLAPETEIEAADGTVTTLGVLPRAQQRLRVATGDPIELVPDLTPASPSARPLRIGCTLPSVFKDLHPGHRVFFDDGRIGAVAESVTPDVVTVRVFEAGAVGTWLGEAKGINLPDTHLHIPALTDEDVTNLAFVAKHADVVGLSFVRRADDVTLLQEHLRELGAEDLGIILKIETVSGFENLPAIITAALASKNVGVMIARGDLAVEAGYERLAEVQEEILWLCEAAHVPVIWATQVLDTLAKTGRPSRAEITDAAASGRAECVMLNKGPYIAPAVESLDDILRRMAEHQDKKRSLLRRLRAWDDAFGTPVTPKDTR